MKTISTLIFLLILVMLPPSNINAQKKKDPPKKKTDQPTTKPPTRYPKTDTPYNNKNYSPEMVFVEGGTFQMGSNDGQSDEKPVHSVTVGSFMIGKYEVTQELWESVMGNNPSNFKGSKRPVEKVSWYDAVEFCNKLSEKEGLQKAYSRSGANTTCDFNANGYRLPTEAEWEYAARGGASSTNTQYSGSNTIGNVAWYVSNSNNTTYEVGTKSPNQLGIYDMSGNVWEWCWDLYSVFGVFCRVNRGGSWVDIAELCRLASRNIFLTPDKRYDDLGFRLVRTKN